MMRQPVLRLGCVTLGLAWITACASAPPAAAPPQRTILTFEQKMGWILRLEEDRVLALPAAAGAGAASGSAHGT